MKLQAISLFLISGLFFTLFHPGHPMTVDSAATLQTVRALARGHLHIPEMMVTRPGREGRHYSYYGPLLPVLSLPGYFLGSQFDNPPPPPGAAEVGWGDWMAMNTNQWISAGILVLLFLTGLEVGLHWKLAYATAIACGVSTLIFPYARDYFSQPLCALLMVVVVYGILRFDGERKRGFLYGAAISAALLPWARMDMGIVFVGLVLWIVLMRGKSTSNRGSDLLVVSIPFLISVSLLFVFDWWRWGRWTGSPYGDHSFGVPLMDSIPRFFISRELSLFLYNPLLILSAYFLIQNWKEWKWIWIPILVMDLLYLIVIGKFRDFHGGVCPGPRYFLSLVPLNLIPLFLGLNQERNRNARVAATVLLLVMVGILINGYEAVVDYTTAPPAWDYWVGWLTAD
ncbi:MAG: hypothetical protein H6752_05450 [Candidatus Omnitrophica bacterium]|nr:hypothetical protein [Candidatus Omnitrophota bacterium]